MSNRLLASAALFAGVLTLALACVPFPVSPEAAKPTPDVSKEEPTRRMQALLAKSERLGGRAQDYWDKWTLFWFPDWSPPHMTYDRIHGGIE